MEGESARLQRRIDDVRSSAAEYINPTPALLIERERLRVREDQIEMEIHAAQTALRQQSMAIKAHEGALKTFHEEGAPELRKRLEGLGR
jgi:regulator of replication initiation timing